MLGHSSTSIIVSTRCVAEDEELREGFASVESFVRSPPVLGKTLSCSVSASVVLLFSERTPALHTQDITARRTASSETMVMCDGMVICVAGIGKFWDRDDKLHKARKIHKFKKNSNFAQ